MSSGIRAKLAKAQAAMTDPRLKGSNPHFNSKFVPRDEALDAILPALQAEGLTLSQGIFGGNLVTKVMDDTEELVLSEWPVTPNPDPQRYMAATTYASRGSLMLAFARAGDSDDDGNRAAESPRRVHESIVTKIREMRDALGVTPETYAAQLEHYGVSIDTDLSQESALALMRAYDQRLQQTEGASA